MLQENNGLLLPELVKALEDAMLMILLELDLTLFLHQEAKINLKRFKEKLLESITSCKLRFIQLT